MKFLRLTGEHFGPFRKPFELPLADLGLVLVRGRNMVSTAADDNGSGKTRLFSALSWVLYGETLPGPDGKVQRGDDVACRFTDGTCVVRLDLEDPDGQWQVERTRRPHAIAFDGNGHYWTGDEAAEKIVARVGYGNLTFRNAVVLGQGAVDRLATADQGAYLRMLDEIQGLSFREALDRAKAWRDAWAEKRRVQEETVERERVKLEQGAAAIALLEQAKASFAAEQRKRVAAADAAARAIQAGISEAMIALDNAKPAAARAAKVRERWERLKELEAATSTTRAALETARRTSGDAQGKLERLELDLRNLLVAHTCPTCRRGIDTKAAVTEVKQLFAEELRERKAVAEAAAVALRDAERAWGEAVTVAARHRKQLPEEFDERAMVELEARSGGAEIERLRKILEECYSRETQARQALEMERGRKWDGAEALRASRAAQAEAAEAIAAAQSQVARCDRTVQAAEYWVEAFGDRGLRSMLFDSVADFLNDRLAHHLRLLAAGEADVTVSALTALKKGGAKERMSVAASWAWGGNGYGAGSAGQGGRVNLALVAAHQDLAEQRSAHPFPLRIYDEPECHVDPRGQEILAQWIRTEASRRGTTFLVTHNPLLAELVEPDRRLLVVLERDGARLEWEG